jgi:hypothetical protein
MAAASLDQAARCGRFVGVKDRAPLPRLGKLGGKDQRQPRPIVGDNHLLAGAQSRTAVDGVQRSQQRRRHGQRLRKLRVMAVAQTVQFVVFPKLIVKCVDLAAVGLAGIHQQQLVHRVAVAARAVEQLHAEAALHRGQHRLSVTGDAVIDTVHAAVAQQHAGRRVGQPRQIAAVVRAQRTGHHGAFDARVVGQRTEQTIQRNADFASATDASFDASRVRHMHNERNGCSHYAGRPFDDG